MVDIFLFLGIALLLTFLAGRLLEKIKVPWIFSALLIGTLLAIYNPFTSVTSSPTFNFLSQLGMYFLLFIIGFEIDLKKMKKIAGFIIEATFFTITISAISGALVIHYLFGYGWFISLIVGVSFATVGEAILLPILDKFKIVNTKLGQTILGIGVFDDIFEIAVLVIIVLFLGIKTSSVSNNNIIFTVSSLVAVFVLTALFMKFKKKGVILKSMGSGILFLLSIAVFFIFLGIGNFSGSGALAALLAGISLKEFIPKQKIGKIENRMRSLCYGFFAPIFFLSAGLALSMKYLSSSLWLILAVFVVAAASKLVASYIIGARKIGKKDSILLGIGLCVRFSTSIVIVKILLDNGLIKEGLYSVIVASSILFTLIVPLLFSELLVRWKLKKRLKK